MRWDANNNVKFLNFITLSFSLLQSVFEAEFPHYRFEALTFEGLMNVIQCNTCQQS